MNKKVLIPLALSAALLGLFFLTRYGLPQFYTPEWAARRVFWGCALIIVQPSVFGKYRFSIAAFAGYPLGLVLGELLGGFQADVPPQYLHYGWLIFLIVFAAACILGVFLQYHSHKTQRS